MKASEMNIEALVTDGYEALDFSQYTAEDVRGALAAEDVQPEGFKALLSPAARPFLEQMAQKASRLTREHFGVNIQLYTPIYIANYCVNHCAYCGFNCTNHIKRAKLTPEEIEHEAQCIANTGLTDILLLTGESRRHSDVDYIAEGVRILDRYFSSIGIEVYPMHVEEYEKVHEAGADYLSVYQETYDRTVYDEVHLSGPKKDYSYRFNAPERGLLAGFRGVSIGALLGLSDFRKDAYCTGMHGWYLQRKYPHAEIGFSVPRLRPYANSGAYKSLVHDADLLQVMLAYRIFMPFAGVNISTRESRSFRDNVITLAPTKMSAGVNTGVGGHDGERKGEAQFEISDDRSVEEARAFLASKGLQVVFNDYVRAF